MGGPALKAVGLWGACALTWLGATGGAWAQGPLPPPPAAPGGPRPTARALSLAPPAGRPGPGPAALPVAPPRPAPLLLPAWLRAEGDAAASAGVGRLQEAVVAAIGAEPVLLSELRLYAASMAPQLSREAALAQLLDERLLAEQAERYGLSPAAGRIEALTRAHPLPFLGAEPAALVRLRRDKAMAEAFVAFRFGAQLGAPVAELERFYASHRDRYPGPFAKEVERVRTDAAEALRAQRLRAFLEERRTASFLRLNPLP